MTAELIDTSDAMDKPSSSVWLSAVMLHLAHVWDDYVYPFVMTLLMIGSIDMVWCLIAI